MGLISYSLAVISAALLADDFIFGGIYAALLPAYAPAAASFVGLVVCGLWRKAETGKRGKRLAGLIAAAAWCNLLLCIASLAFWLTRMLAVI